MAISLNRGQFSSHVVLFRLFPICMVWVVGPLKETVILLLGSFGWFAVPWSSTILLALIQEPRRHSGSPESSKFPMVKVFSVHPEEPGSWSWRSNAIAEAPVLFTDNNFARCFCFSCVVMADHTFKGTSKCFNLSAKGNNPFCPTARHLPLFASSTSFLFKLGLRCTLHWDGSRRLYWSCALEFYSYIWSGYILENYCN